MLATTHGSCSLGSDLSKDDVLSSPAIGGLDKDTLMVAPTPYEPTQHNTPTAPPTGPNRLARTSFVLALVPLVLLVLFSLGGFVTNRMGDQGLPFLTPLGIAAAVGYLASHVSSIGAVATGWRVLRHATRYPANQASQGLAVAGLVLGVVVLVVLLCSDGLGAVVGIVCSNSSSGCF